MVRKSIVMLLVGLVAFALTFSGTIAGESTTVYCHPWWQEECVVGPGDQLVIQNTWASCRRGLVKAFLMAIDAQEYTLNGVPLWDTQDPSQYWGPIQEFSGPGLEFCMGHPSTGYISYWERQLDLAPGDYELGVTISLGHPVTDAADYDEDGRPDLFSGPFSATVLIHVLGD